MLKLAGWLNLMDTHSRGPPVQNWLKFLPMPPQIVTHMYNEFQDDPYKVDMTMGSHGCGTLLHRIMCMSISASLTQTTLYEMIWSILIMH